MFIRYISRNKKLTHIPFLAFVIPYLLLTLTVGGFHNGSIEISDCNHSQTLVSDETANAQIKHQEKTGQHDSETCQICHWLKSPSVVIQFLPVHTQFDFVCISFPRNSNPILSSLSIHRFTIRPPPFFSCFSA